MNSWKSTTSELYSCGIPLFTQLYPPRWPSKFETLFRISSKQELIKHGKRTVMDYNDLVSAIAYANLGDYNCYSKHFEWQPKESYIPRRKIEILTDPERWKEIGEIGPKVRNLFDARKKLSAHLFFRDEQDWHLIYFSNRDRGEEGQKQHWQHGSHVHLINHLWPHYKPNQLHDFLFSTRRTQIKDSLHMRFSEYEDI